MADSIEIRRLGALGARDLADLCDVLVDCVEGGASVGFLAPLSRVKADAFWRGVADSLARGERALLAAFDAVGGIVGTVQVVVNLPENQPHRADVAKMLVHRRARRQGVGERLLAAAEACALELGRTLLVLDTVTGSNGWRLYARQGWQRCGDIPDYALWPDRTPCSTTYFFKALRPPALRVDGALRQARPPDAEHDAGEGQHEEHP